MIIFCIKPASFFDAGFFIALIYVSNLMLVICFAHLTAKVTCISHQFYIIYQNPVNQILNSTCNLVVWNSI